MGFLSCPLCEHVTLADLQELQQKIAKSLSRNLTCPICSSIIQGITSLHYHLAGHIPIKCPVIPVINPVSPEQIPSLERLEIRDESQQRPTHLKDDLRTTDPSSSFQEPNLSPNGGEQPKVIHHNCDMCGLVFSSEYFLTLHKDIIHSNANGFEVTCKLCESSFKDLEEYRLHVREVHSERPYICERCPKSFKMKGGLLVHTRMYHDNSSPSTCQICQKHFTSKALKELHEKRYHVNVKQTHNIEVSAEAQRESSNALGDAKICLETLMHQTSQSPISNQSHSKSESSPCIDTTGSQYNRHSPKNSKPLNSPPDLSPRMDSVHQSSSSLSSSIEQATITKYDIHSYQNNMNNMKESQLKQIKQATKAQRPKKQTPSNKKSNLNQLDKANEELLKNNMISPEMLLHLVATGASTTTNSNSSPNVSKFVSQQNPLNMTTFQIEEQNQLNSFYKTPQISTTGSYFSSGTGFFIPQQLPPEATPENFNAISNPPQYPKSNNLIAIPLTEQQQMETFNSISETSQTQCNFSVPTPPEITKPVEFPVQSKKVPSPTQNPTVADVTARPVNEYIISLPSNINLGTHQNISFPQTREDKGNSPLQPAKKGGLETSSGGSGKKQNKNNEESSTSKKEEGSSKGSEGKQWECDTCKKSFTTKYFLKKHKRLHTGETPYSCEECGKTFVFQQSYHKHIFYHSDDKPHLCPHCGRAFKEMSTLHNHIRIHTGEKPFVCATCGKAFRQRVSYFVHQRIHTGQMPYRCEACQRVFRYKVSLRSHKCSGRPMENLLLQNTTEMNPIAQNGVNSATESASIDSAQTHAQQESVQTINPIPELRDQRNTDQNPSTSKDLQWYMQQAPLDIPPPYGETNNNCLGGTSISPKNSPQKADPKEIVASTSYPNQSTKEGHSSYANSTNFSSSIQFDADFENEIFLRSLFS